MREATIHKNGAVQIETRKLKRELTLLPLLGLMYFTVCGGTFGIEPLYGLSGPGLAIALIFVTPLIFSIPNMLMVREMNSMMPVEGGYYHWVKKAFGPFVGFMAGWMNWVVSWVGVPIYPILAAYYLGYFIPPLREGAMIGGIFVEAWLLQWLVALILIWAISALNIRSSRLSGLITNWLGLVMLIPLVFMSIVGLGNMLNFGLPENLPFIPRGETLFGALSTGLFVAMWNFMGWELPTAAGDEIVNSKRTYPLVMALVLSMAIATYAVPTVTGLYGGAGEGGRYLLWGQEAGEEGIGARMAGYGISEAQLSTWGVDPRRDMGWQLPDIAHAVGAKATGSADGALPRAMGLSVTAAAVLSMIGLFIGNSLVGTRVPFAMAEDGMMPRWMVKVHPRYGTPWVSILFCGVIFSVFSLQTFSTLVVVDVFLNMLVLLTEFLALWCLRFKLPHVKRSKVPGGYVGLVLITLGPLAIITLAVVSQYLEEGFSSIGLALAAMTVGALLYFPIRARIKPGIPDVDPFRLEPAQGE